MGSLPVPLACLLTLAGSMLNPPCHLHVCLHSRGTCSHPMPLGCLLTLGVHAHALCLACLLTPTGSMLTLCASCMPAHTHRSMLTPPCPLHACSHSLGLCSHVPLIHSPCPCAPAATPVACPVPPQLRPRWGSLGQEEDRGQTSGRSQGPRPPGPAPGPAPTLTKDPSGDAGEGLGGQTWVRRGSCSPHPAPRKPHPPLHETTPTEAPSPSQETLPGKPHPQGLPQGPTLTGHTPSQEVPNALPPV